MSLKLNNKEIIRLVSPDGKEILRVTDSLTGKVLYESGTPEYVEFLNGKHPIIFGRVSGYASGVFELPNGEIWHSCDNATWFVTDQNHNLLRSGEVEHTNGESINTDVAVLLDNGNIFSAGFDGYWIIQQPSGARVASGRLPSADTDATVYAAIQLPNGNIVVSYQRAMIAILNRNGGNVSHTKIDSNGHEVYDMTLLPTGEIACAGRSAYIKFISQTGTNIRGFTLPNWSGSCTKVLELPNGNLFFLGNDSDWVITDPRGAILKQGKITSKYVTNNSDLRQGTVILLSNGYILNVTKYPLAVSVGLWLLLDLEGNVVSEGPILGQSSLGDVIELSNGNIYMTGYNQQWNEGSIKRVAPLKGNKFSGTFSSQTVEDAYMAVTDAAAGSQFSNQTNLTRVVLPDAKYIGSNAFENSPLTEIVLPVADTIGASAFASAVNAETTIVKLSVDQLFPIRNQPGLDKDAVFPNGWDKITFVAI